jgi:hypothetical protein
MGDAIEDEFGRAADSRILSAERPMYLVGLSLNFVGALMLAIWGLPQPRLDAGVALAVEVNSPVADGRTAAELGEAVRQRRQRHQFVARSALGLLAAGFALQVVAHVG